MPNDLADLEEGFKHAIGKLPDYKRLAAWDFVRALRDRNTKLENEIDSLANELLARQSNAS